MSTDPRTTGTDVTAIFRTREDATRASAPLREAGMPEPHLRLTGAPEPSEEEGKGLFESIGEIFRPARDGEAKADDAARGPCVMTLRDLSASQGAAAERILREAGATRVETQAARVDSRRGDPADARPVQAGFGDVPPGYVPEQAEFPAVRSGDERQGPDEIADGKGRFAEQLDHLPGDADRERPR